MNRLSINHTTVVITLIMTLVAKVSFGQLDHNTPYKISVKHSGKSLDVEGAVVDNEKRIIQYQYQGGENQKFILEPTDDGHYKIRVKHSNKCLDIRGGVEATANGAGLIQYSCHNNFNQHFALESLEDGFYRIRARHSNKYLTIANSNPDDLAPVVQMDWVNGDNQKFQLQRPEKFPVVFDITQRLKESESGARRSRTQVYISSAGLVKCISTIVSDAIGGYTAHLSINLKDEHGNVIKTIGSPGYGINAFSQRTVTWGETELPPAILTKINNVEVVFYRNPSHRAVANLDLISGIVDILL